MDKLPYQCRKCKKLTIHMIRIVTDNLPPYVKVLECSVCSVMGIGVIDEELIE